LIIVLLVFNFEFPREPKIPPPQPKIIMAELVKLDAVPSAKPTKGKPEEAPPQDIAETVPKPEPDPPKPEPEPKPEPKPEPPPPPEKKPEPPKPDPVKLKQEQEKQQQLEKQKAEKQKQLEQEKAKAEAAKKEAAKKAEQQKQEAEKKRKEQEEAQRKKQQEEAARKQREQAEKAALAKAMAAEEQALAAASAQEAVTSYQAVIQRAVQNNWSRPPTARTGMRAILAIQMLRSGEIVDATVVKSSGNDAFDRSAVAAVKRTGHIPELAKLAQESPAVFDQNFRRFQLDFYPEDLRQ
jgi:colicin import membrane protein